MTIKTLTKLAAAIAAFSFTSATQAISLFDAGVVGSFTGGYSPGTEENTIAQKILDLPAGPIGSSIGVYGIGQDSWRSGTLTFAQKLDSGATHVGAGFEYVIGKYDGPNGGAVLFYIGGAAVDLPAVSNPLWGKAGTDQYALSHWTAYNGTGVPDGGATIALLGVGLVGLGMMRRKIS